MSNRETHEMLRRILGDGTDALLTQANGKDPDAAALNAAGINADAMLTQAKKQIDHAVKLSASGINPPVPLEALSEAEFNRLDIPTLEKYLAAGDVNVDRLLSRTRELLDQQRASVPANKASTPTPEPIQAETSQAGFLERLRAYLPKPNRAPVFGMAATAIVLVAVGVGVLQLAPTTPQIPPAEPETRQLAVTLESAPIAKANDTIPSVAELAPSLMSAPSLTRALSTPIEAMSLEEIDSAAEAAVLNDATETNPIEPAQNNELALTTNHDTPATSVPETEILDTAENETITEQNTAASDSWAVTHQPDAPAPKQKVEFVFSPGDTFSHGMAQSGLSNKLSTALAERVGTDFHPGDKLIIFFEDDEFEQLVVIRRKKQPLTITADLKTSSAPAGTTETIDVSGKIESSLYAALEKALDANAAQRITWLLQNRGVPLTTLPKGAAFNIQIEQIKSPDGQTLGYGEIRSVHLDAGKRGKFEV
ncbi:hypothetical protein OAT46_00495 [Gammaproteobacteria bacterium]|nr:hypothetical protein [Gammaproteobacteria bacterium]